MNEYHVDVTKRPLSPPNREMISTAVGMFETKASQVRGRQYLRYLARYREAVAAHNPAIIMDDA